MNNIKLTDYEITSILNSIKDGVGLWNYIEFAKTIINANEGKIELEAAQFLKECDE